jgi:hypothetical protein
MRSFMWFYHLVNIVPDHISTFLPLSFSNINFNVWKVARYIGPNPNRANLFGICSLFVINFFYCGTTIAYHPNSLFGDFVSLWGIRGFWGEVWKLVIRESILSEILQKYDMFRSWSHAILKLIITWEKFYAYKHMWGCLRPAVWTVKRCFIFYTLLFSQCVKRKK